MCAPVGTRSGRGQRMCMHAGGMAKPLAAWVQPACRPSACGCDGCGICGRRHPPQGGVAGVGGSIWDPHLPSHPHPRRNPHRPTACEGPPRAVVTRRDQGCESTRRRVILPPQGADPERSCEATSFASCLFNAPRIVSCHASHERQPEVSGGTGSVRRASRDSSAVCPGGRR